MGVPHTLNMKKVILFGLLVLMTVSIAAPQEKKDWDWSDWLDEEKPDWDGEKPDWDGEKPDWDGEKPDWDDCDDEEDDIEEGDNDALSSEEDENVFSSVEDRRRKGKGGKGGKPGKPGKPSKPGKPGKPCKPKPTEGPEDATLPDY